MNRESITMVFVIFMTFLFMNLVLTYVLASPIDSILEGILNGDYGSYVNNYTNAYIPYYRQALILVFALAIAGPFGWLISKVFSSEPYYDPYNPYNNGGGRFR